MTHKKTMEASEGEGSDKTPRKTYKETMPKLFSNFTPKLIYRFYHTNKGT